MTDTCIDTVLDVQGRGQGDQFNHVPIQPRYRPQTIIYLMLMPEKFYVDESFRRAMTGGCSLRSRVCQDSGCPVSAVMRQMGSGRLKFAQSDYGMAVMAASQHERANALAERRQSSG